MKIYELRYSGTNTYLIEGERGAILFDTGWAGTFPAFCAERFDPLRAAEETLRRGVRVTGATAYFMGEEDNGFGPIITQKPVEVLPGDTAAALSERIMRQGEWPALTEAVGLYCAGRLRIEGERVVIA